MALEIKTSIKINATPTQVWQVFSDFNTYPDWNPFIKEVSGDIAEGKTISINAGGMAFKPKVLVFRENKELKWLGKLGFSGIFDGAHRFLLEDNGDGSTTFHHSENFSGILIPLFKNKLLTDTKTGFEKMNKALKKRVEERYNQ